MSAGINTPLYNPVYNDERMVVSVLEKISTPGIAVPRGGTKPPDLIEISPKADRKLISPFKAELATISISPPVERISILLGALISIVPPPAVVPTVT